MSKLQYALHMPPAGSIITPDFAKSTAQMNKAFLERAQQEVVMANQLMKQDPSISRTDALLRASTLLERTSESAIYEEPEQEPQTRERMRG